MAYKNSFTPGEVRIDGMQVLVNNHPVSLSPLKHPQKREIIRPVTGQHTSAGHGMGKVSNVKWIHQAKSDWCGRSSQAMLVNYWKPGTGADTKKFQVAHGLNGFESVKRLTGKPYIGSKPTSLDAVARSVEAGNPALLYTKIYRQEGNPTVHPGHIIVLTGYDPNMDAEDGGQFYANDPYAKNAETGTNVTKVGRYRLTKKTLENLLQPQGAGVSAVYPPTPASE